MAVDIAAVLTATIDDFKAKMAEADVSMKTMTDSGASNMSKLSSIGKGAMLGIGAAVVGVGVAAVDFGNKLEESQAGLQAALSAAHISWDSVKGSVDQTANSAAHYGFTQAQVEDALKMGVISTQNYAAAHRNLSIAVDLAAAKHIDLSSAMLAVDKAAIGQSRALKQLGIDLPVVQSNALKVKNAQEALAAANLAVLATQQKVADGQIKASAAAAALQAAHDKVWTSETKLKDLQNAHIQILDALQQRLKGQAAAAADTFTGKLNAMKATGENLAAHLGLVLIPILEKVITVVMEVVTWFEHHKAAAIALAVVIGGVLIVAMAAAIAEFIAGITAVDIATGGILVAIGLLVVGIVYLSTHWKQVWDDIVNFVKGHMLEIAGVLIFILGPIGILITAGLELALHWKAVWDFMKTAAQDAWTVIGPVFNFIKTLGIDYIQTAITVFQGIWNTAWYMISGAVSTAWNFMDGIFAFFSTAFNGILDVVHTLWSYWDDAWNGLSNAVATMWNFVSPIFDTIKRAAQDVANVVGGVGKAIGAIGGAAGGALSFVTGGLLAGGGPAQAGVPYIVGESGPELFIPSASGVVMPTGSFGPGTGGSPIAGGGGGSATLEVHLNINGQNLYQATFNDLWTVLLQNKRSLVNLNLD